MSTGNFSQDHYAHWAKIWDEDPGRVETAQTVAENILKHMKLAPHMTGLDFGCGTGLLTMFMQPFLKKITAVDISEEMLRQLHQKIIQQNIANIEAHNLFWEKELLPNAPYHIIFSSMTLHHINDLKSLFNKFYAVLQKNGCFCAADLYKEQGDFHSDHKGVAHLGFVPQNLQTMLKHAGFSNVQYEQIYTITKTVANGAQKSFPVFLICAEKL